MASVLKVGLDVLALLEDAPAFATDIADEMDTSAHLAGQRLIYLHSKGLITRKAFYISENKTRWLYMLPEHDQLMKG